MTKSRIGHHALSLPADPKGGLADARARRSVMLPSSLRSPLTIVPSNSRLEFGRRRIPTAAQRSLLVPRIASNACSRSCWR